MPGEPSSQPADDAPPREILRSLRRILQAVDLHGRSLKARYGLTGPQVVCLREIERGGSLNPGQLARSVGLKPPTVTGIVDRLEHRGLVTRRRRHSDKRQVRIELTDAGTEVVRRAPAPLQERFVERLEALPPERRAAIAARLDEVVGLLEAEHIDAGPLLASGAASPAAGELADEPRPGAGGARDAGA